MNDANQKTNFYKTTLAEDSNMKEYAAVLGKRLSMMMNDSVHEPAPVIRTDTHRRLTDKVFASLKKVATNEATTRTLPNTTVTALSKNNGAKGLSSPKNATSTHEVSTLGTKKAENRTADSKLRGQIECCEVNVSYSFQEGLLQKLFVQILLLILVVTRWLVTHNGLSINQHMFLLVISLTNVADILDFYSYTSLEVIFMNSYLLYVVLFISSLSLLQYVFMQESFELDTRGPSSLPPSSNVGHTMPFYNWDKPPDLNSFQMDDNYPTGKSALLAGANKGHYDKDKSDKNLFGLQAILKQYNLIKEKLQPPGSLNEPVSQMTSFNNTNNDANNFMNEMWRHERRMSMDRHRKNLFNKKHCGDMSNLRRFFSCGEKQSESMLLVMLLRLVFHDAWFLAFRVFFISKLGLGVVLSQKENVVFFAAKNSLIIMAQIYKVFNSTRKDSFKGIMTNLRLRPNPNLGKGNFKSDINLSALIDRSNSIYFSSEINETNPMTGERLTSNPYLYFKKPTENKPNAYQQQQQQHQRSTTSLQKLPSPQYLFSSKSPLNSNRFANIYPGYPVPNFPFGSYYQTECVPYVKKTGTTVADELVYDLNDDDKNSTYQRCRMDQMQPQQHQALKKPSYTSNDYEASCRLMNESTVSEYYPAENKPKLKSANDYLGFYMGPRRSGGDMVDEFVPKMLLKDQGPFFSSAGKAIFGLPDYRKSRDTLFHSYKHRGGGGGGERDMPSRESSWDDNNETGAVNNYKASKI